MRFLVIRLTTVLGFTEAARAHVALPPVPGVSR
jgi:hypothetical protein